TYTVTFDLVAENLGDVTLSDLVLTDDIVTQFAGLAPTGFVATDGSLTASGTWDGTAASNILAPGQMLAPGQSGAVSITFTVTPGAVTSVDNNADVSATAPGGGSVVDTSTSGINPDPDDDDVPDEEIPTVVGFVEAPVIGLAKRVIAGPTSNGDGTFDVTYELVVSNLGDTDLLNLQITDDMAATYAAADGFATLSVVSGDFTVNPTYDGSADVDLLAGSDSLAVGASGAVQVSVQVTPGAFLGPYDNTATATAASPGGILVTDDSQDGVDVDPDGNGDPGDNSDPTPVTFPSDEFDLAITKTGPAEVNDGDAAIWSIVVTNLGPGVAPAPITVTDLMPAGLTYVGASGAGWVCTAVGQTVTCTRAANLAVGANATITLETAAFGDDGDQITNVAVVESGGGVETITENNDDDATLVIGVLPATGRNLDSFVWFGLLMIIGGVFLVLTARRRADLLWIEHGVRV
ncbi:MAG: DUF11 domain-containing protein, partial [Acidimicrobiia bacterium]|nr:DUF11 domain-containing protein [Acidimicrobiia bacterium]